MSAPRSSEHLYIFAAAIAQVVLGTSLFAAFMEGRPTQPIYAVPFYCWITGVSLAVLFSGWWLWCNQLLFMPNKIAFKSIGTVTIVGIALFSYYMQQRDFISVTSFADQTVFGGPDRLTRPDIHLLFDLFVPFVAPLILLWLIAPFTGPLVMDRKYSTKDQFPRRTRPLKLAARAASPIVAYLLVQMAPFWILAPFEGDRIRQSTFFVAWVSLSFLGFMLPLFVGSYIRKDKFAIAFAIVSSVLCWTALAVSASAITGIFQVAPTSSETSQFLFYLFVTSGICSSINSLLLYHTGTSPIHAQFLPQRKQIETAFPPELGSLAITSIANTLVTLSIIAVPIVAVQYFNSRYEIYTLAIAKNSPVEQAKLIADLRHFVDGRKHFTVPIYSSVRSQHASFAWLSGDHFRFGIPLEVTQRPEWAAWAERANDLSATIELQTLPIESPLEPIQIFHNRVVISQELTALEVQSILQLNVDPLDLVFHNQHVDSNELQLFQQLDDANYSIRSITFINCTFDVGSMVNKASLLFVRIQLIDCKLSLNLLQKLPQASEVILNRETIPTTSAAQLLANGNRLFISGKEEQNPSEFPNWIEAKWNGNDYWEYSLNPYLISQSETLPTGLKLEFLTTDDLGRIIAMDWTVDSSLQLGKINHLKRLTLSVEQLVTLCESKTKVAELATLETLHLKNQWKSDGITAERLSMFPSLKFLEIEDPSEDDVIALTALELKSIVLLGEDVRNGVRNLELEELRKNSPAQIIIYDSNSLELDQESNNDY